MAFFFPGIQPKKDISDNERSQEFENLVGNYLITDHQRTRLTERIVDYVKTNPHKSTFMLRSNDAEPRWFQVSVGIEEIKAKPESEEEVDESAESEPEPTTHFP